MNSEKLNKRIDALLEYGSDDYILNINLSNYVSNRLLKYQYLHVFNLIAALNAKNNMTVLDGSDTGTGKTYTSIAICKQENYRPFIICPKTIMSTWNKICNYFSVKPLSIVNYETIKNGKQYDNRQKRIISKYIKIDEKFENERRYIWTLPKNTLVIFDEAHKCKDRKSLNSKLLMSLKRFNVKILLLSATISDTPETFHVFGYMLGFYKKLNSARNWINGMLIEDKNKIGSVKQSSINKNIYPSKGSRMQIKELGEEFPKNQISPELYNIGKSNESFVNNIYNNILKDKYKLNKINSNNTKLLGINILNKIMYERQQLENIKISIIVNLTNEYIENGYNIAIFVNFNKTIEQLSKILKTKCIIQGNQSEQERENNINDFQNNRSRIIICNIKAGGQSISLHDIHGVPRISLISPSFSSIELVQVLGRIYRAGAKTPALQRIIFCANTCEEIICNKLKEKIKFISKINDDDLFLEKYQNEILNSINTLNI